MTYVGLFDVLDPKRDFGGLGVNEDGVPTGRDAEWGAGPVNLFRLATEYPERVLSVGLYIAETGRPGALRRIGDGEFDPEIDHLGATLRDLGQPILLRIGYEFDGHWNPGYEDTTSYINAFRRIASRIRSLGAANVATVWHASASPVDDIAERHHENLEDWYPGDDVVDWIGLSWFLEADRIYNPRYPVTQLQLAEEVLALARQHGKPALIAEAAPQGFDLEDELQANIGPLLGGEAGRNLRPVAADEIWDRWFSPVLRFVEHNRDVIRGFSYINANWDEQGLWCSPYPNGYWGDSRIETHSSLIERWNTELAKPWWILSARGH